MPHAMNCRRTVTHVDVETFGVKRRSGLYRQLPSTLRLLDTRPAQRQDRSDELDLRAGLVSVTFCSAEIITLPQRKPQAFLPVAFSECAKSRRSPDWRC